MTDPIKDAWARQHGDACFSDTSLCHKRLSWLERRVHRRNIVEFATGGAIIVACSIGLVATIVTGHYAFAIAAMALLVGTALVLKHLYAFGRTEAAKRETPCLEHLKRQLERQRDLLRSVPGWYLFPLVPGVLAFYTAVVIGATPTIGFEAAIRDTVWPFSGTVAFFVLTAWLNLRSARLLDRRISELAALSK